MLRPLNPEHHLSPALSPTSCKDRVHSGRVCGDMVDTLCAWVLVLGSGCFWLAQVQLFDHLGQKEHLQDAVGLRGTHAHGLAAKSPSHFPFMPAIAEPAVFIHLSGFHGGSVLHRRQGFGIAALADTVTAHGCLQSQCFVWAFCIVDGSPLVKGRLHVWAITPASPGQHFCFQRAMEALFFALGLRMIRPAMTGPDAQTHQPDVQTGELRARATPGSAIVPQHFVGQSMHSETRDQMCLHGFLPLVLTGRQHHVVSGVIIERAQRMAPALTQGKMTFKVHLPQLIGCRTLKALKGLGSAALLRRYQLVPMQNPGDGAGGRQIRMPKILQAAAQLARSPSRMFPAQRHHPIFDHHLGSSRTGLRPARTIGQTFQSTAVVSFQPLVSHRGADAKPTAQQPYIRIGLTSQVHKLKSYRYQIFHRPRHSDHTLPTLSAMCPPCPRTPVHYVPSPYTSWRRGRRIYTICLFGNLF